VDLGGGGCADGGDGLREKERKERRREEKIRLMKEAAFLYGFFCVVDV
jgi:hypothetical protein